MADAKAKMVLVRAKSRGQKPDGNWVDEGGAPFSVPEGLFSERWMKKLTADEIRAHEAATAPAASVASLSASLDKVTAERDAMDRAGKELSEKLKDAELGRDIAMQAADLLKVDLGDLIAELAKVTGKASDDPLSGVSVKPPAAKAKKPPATADGS